MPLHINIKVKCFVTVAALLLSQSVTGQGLDIEGVRKQRWRMIDRYQFSPGISIDHNANTVVTPSVAIGIGNYRNLINAKAGIGYELVNPISRHDREGLNLHRIAPFASLSLNLIRWRTGSFYIGGDIAYKANLRTRHQLPNGASIDDRDIANAHPSVAAEAGIKFNYWDIRIHYRFDIAPAFGQKYIYESSDYNFDVLYESIYERSRIGLCLSYHFTLRHL